MLHARPNVHAPRELASASDSDEGSRISLPEVQCFVPARIEIRRRPAITKKCSGSTELSFQIFSRCGVGGPRNALKLVITEKLMM
jgi:hypothetical protein